MGEPDTMADRSLRTHDEVERDYWLLIAYLRRVDPLLDSANARKALDRLLGDAKQALGFNPIF